MEIPKKEEEEEEKEEIEDVEEEELNEEVRIATVAGSFEQLQ